MKCTGWNTNNQEWLLIYYQLGVLEDIEALDYCDILFCDADFDSQIHCIEF